MVQWKLAEAKNRFSELVNRALLEGPQTVHRRKDVVIVLAAKEYERLKRKKTSFKDFLTRGVDFDGLDLRRNTSVSRDLSL